MICFFSGWHASRKKRELHVIKRGGLKDRCFAYPTIEKLDHKQFASYTYAPWQQEVYKTDLDNNVGIMMDSGAFAFRHFNNKFKANLPESFIIEPYVKFCLAEQHKWKLYFTLDLALNAEGNYARHKALIKRGIFPAPVFHGDDSVEYIKRYADLGCDVIGCASPRQLRTTLSAKRRYLDTVFNEVAKLNMRIHGLAMTSVWQMLSYPFWSVDSSSWTRCASVGCLMRFDPVRMRNTILHVSEVQSSKSVSMDKAAQRRLEKELGDEGWDYQLLRTDFTERHCYNAATMMKVVEVAEKRQHGGYNLLW